MRHRPAGAVGWQIPHALGFTPQKPIRRAYEQSPQAWLAEHAGQIEVFYPPSYSPELNPNERLNAELKHVIGSKVPARTKTKLRAVTDEHITQLQQQPERVRAYFQDPRVKYAAGE